MYGVFAYSHFLHYILLPQSYALKPVIGMKHCPAVYLCLLCVSCLDNQFKVLLRVSTILKYITVFLSSYENGEF